ncbi:MAG: ABC transporter substrate-binding protein [Nitrospira sp.]|nr:ABC transporter substrate-binding protein [Candidatus Manganitrophaceae bacterium]HIL35641.1 ABC transporter substrate-binding protein [Candidatus Manganitrophaceae bacterium]
MKSLFLFFLLTFSTIQSNTAECRSFDPVSKDALPQRIISMTLGTDEILLSLIDPGRILAVTHYAVDSVISNVSEQAKVIPNQIRQAGVEQVAALDPDLVLVASYTSADVVKQLTEIGFPVVRLEAFSSIDGIKENIRTIGRSVGASKKAEEVIAGMVHRLLDLEEQISSFSERPGILSYSPGGWTAGSETTFHEMVVRSGGRNLAAEVGVRGHKKLSLETIVTLDPEIIILSGWQPEESDFLETIRTHPALAHLSAIQKKRVYVFPERYLTTVSHYIVDATLAMARLIHPTRFEP